MTVELAEKPPEQEVISTDQNNDPEANHLYASSASTSAVEKRLLRKIYFHLMAPLWIIFAFGFLDRINLGNVAVLGIVNELHLQGNVLNVALQIFFVPYILLEIPSNIVLRKIAPSTWISGLTFLWGESYIHTDP